MHCLDLICLYYLKALFKTWEQSDTKTFEFAWPLRIWTKVDIVKICYKFSFKVNL